MNEIKKVHGIWWRGKGNYENLVFVSPVLRYHEEIDKFGFALEEATPEDEENME